MSWRTPPDWVPGDDDDEEEDCEAEQDEVDNHIERREAQEDEDNGKY